MAFLCQDIHRTVWAISFEKYLLEITSYIYISSLQNNSTEQIVYMKKIVVLC